MAFIVLMRSGVYSGCASMSPTMVGTPVKRLHSSVSMRRRPSPASHFRIMTMPSPRGMEERKTPARAVMWKSGTESRDLGFGSGTIFVVSSRNLSRLPMLRWVCTTPLGKPVEPEVYMIMTSSSASTSLVEGKGFPWPVARTSSHLAAPKSAASSAVPRTNIFLTALPSRKGCAAERRSASAMSTVQAESFTAYSSSLVPQREFSGTATAPMAVTARKPMHSSGRLRMARPTTLPFLMPKEAESSAANASIACSAWAKVTRSLS
mmetsp:Transcript_2852/g.7701  ORF Transcript_2852/g.7701 Transcript_2852/m.7701 type:complete len:264 (-) Transcript_2852:243-1034(-)